MRLKEETLSCGCPAGCDCSCPSCRERRARHAGEEHERARARSLISRHVVWACGVAVLPSSVISELIGPEAMLESLEGKT